MVGHPNYNITPIQLTLRKLGIFTLRDTVVGLR
jgi:hypothetical protein